MLQLVARCEGRELWFPIPDAQATLGASRDNDLVIPFPGVSRHHAVLRRRDGRLEVADSGSKNGVRVKGERVSVSSLEPGQQIQLGWASLTLEEVPAPEVELALDFGPAARRPPSERTRATEQVAFLGNQAPEEAAALFREVHRAHERGGFREAQRLLPDVLRVLGAAYFAVFERDGSKPATVLASAGTPPPGFDAVLRGPVSILAADTTPSPLAVSAGKALVSLGSASENAFGIAAHFAGVRTEIPRWKQVLFVFLATPLLPKTREEVQSTGREERSSQGGGSLRFPAGMVVGRSPAMTRALEQIRQMVASGLDVLLTGDTGTGKELFARTIHDSGPVAGGPFVAINCAALPVNLLEAELFGVHRGAATGVDARPGRFVQADGGTLLLDEIGELEEALQAKLLRVLQEREVLSLGAPAPRKIRVRIVATTNRDLEQLAQEGAFRADLYYRLRKLELRLPPLRDRLDDIPDLVAAFALRAAKKHGRLVRGVSRQAVDLLCAHDWPGNVRDLETEVERAVLACSNGEPLRSEHFSSVRRLVARRVTPTAGSTTVTVPAFKPPDLSETQDLSLKGASDAAERTAIVRALQLTGGNRSKAADLLGISRNGLAAKLKELKI